MKYQYKMNQYNLLSVQLSNSQLNKLKSGIKIGTRGTLNPSSNVIGESNNETNFLHKLLLTNIQVSEIRQDFANNSQPAQTLQKFSCLGWYS